MPIDAVVRVSFQASDATKAQAVQALQAVREALTGRKQDGPGPDPGPFTKPGTGLYRCADGQESAVMKSLQGLTAIIRMNADILDHVFVYATRTPTD